MPCDSIRLCEVKLQACDPDLMFAALDKLHLHPERDPQDKNIIMFAGRESIDCATGEGAFTALRDVNEIKRAYSTAALEATADQFGWALEQTDSNQFELSARF